MRRDPHAERPGSVFLLRHCDGSAMSMLLWRRGVDNCVCFLRLIPHGGGVLGVCSGSQRVTSFGVAQRWRRRCGSRRVLSLPLPVCGGGVEFCCVHLFVCVVCGGGVRFGALCNSASSYMMRQCSCLLYTYIHLNWITHLELFLKSHLNMICDEK
jgi:hypothetical protein